jgi:hypothetical protein
MPHTPSPTPTEAEDIAFFVADAAAKIRRMPLAEARRFLRGLLAVTEADELPELRAAYQALCDSDAQLELLLAPLRKAA